MSPRTTIIAAVVAAGLAVYIYLYEREPVEFEIDSGRQELFQIEADSIEEIEIRHQNGEDLKMQKSGESWRILEPVEAPADSIEVESLADNIASMEQERVVAEGPDVNLEEFGLEQPETEVYFKTAGNETPSGFLFGDETPTGSANLYAKLADDDRIFVVPSFTKANFDKKVWDLRDKKVLHFERDDVEKLVLRNRSGQIVLARENENRWNVTAPSFCRADRYKASGLVSQLDTAKMEEIVSETTQNLSQSLEDFGLTNPPYEVEVHLVGGSSAKLQVGDEIEGQFYARDVDRPMIFLVNSSLVDEITKDASEYRSTRLFEYATYQVNKVQIAAIGEEVRVLEKTVEGEDEEAKWLETAPRSRELDRDKVEDLLYKMNGTNAEDFAADSSSALEAFGLHEPAFTITVWSEEGETEEEISVGKPEGEWIYALRKGDEPVLKLMATSWEEVVKLMSFEEEEEEEEEEK